VIHRQDAKFAKEYQCFFKTWRPWRSGVS
jgi:hypothetical protein